MFSRSVEGILRMGLSNLNLQWLVHPPGPPTPPRKRLMEQTVLVTHPYTGEQMLLNYNQRVQFFQDLQHMRAPQIPPTGFPPHMPQHMGYGPCGTPGNAHRLHHQVCRYFFGKSREHGSWLIFMVESRLKC